MLSRPLPIHRRLLLVGAASLLLLTPAAAQETMKVGLVAAMSGQSAKSGEAIVRGLNIAIDEKNFIILIIKHYGQINCNEGFSCTAFPARNTNDFRS